MNNETFTTILKDGDVNGLAQFFTLPDVDIDVNELTATIKWHIDVDAKERGIKTILIIVDQVTAEIVWHTVPDELTSSERNQLIVVGGVELANDTIEGTVILDSNSLDKPWEVIVEFYFEQDGGLMPAYVDIDFIAHTITVS